MGKTSFADFFKKHQNIIPFFICSIGVAVNLLFSQLVSILKLPLYLDTIGTIVIASIGGYLPGATVGFYTNIIKATYETEAIYYGVLNVMIGVAATLITTAGFKKKWHRMLVCILSFSLIGGGVGSLIPWYMEGITSDSEALRIILEQTGIFNPYTAHLVASILRDLPDKIITVCIVELILLVIPKNFYRYSSFSMWMQQPFFKDDFKARDKTKVRVISVRMKTLLALVFVFSVIALAGTNISLFIYHKSIMDDHKKLALGTSSLAATFIDGDKIEDYLISEGNVPGYDETKNHLTNILTSSPEISYLYVYKIYNQGFEVVFDIDTENVPAAEIGTKLPFDKALVPYIPQLLAGEQIEPVISNDEHHGLLITAVKPVFNSENRCVCYAIADVDINMLKKDERSFLVEVISVYLGFFLCLCSFAIWLIDFNIIYPLKSITAQVDKFKNAKESQNKLDKFVKEFKEVNIHTGDEVEELFKSLFRMTLIQSEQTRSIRKLSNETAKMQDGLIIIMADFVENRDSDTGAHVQKTAAYVKIIVEALKKKGYYSETVTSKFISDVVRSAPLHDVGKIKIPDRVLNKPGKLTDEEYAIMKTHTTEGKKIMESVISTVEGENYLLEARNMAAYHHERWDGKGYPEQLKGEEIPLSARIMAVADVFDALSSPRVYKPAFSLEKSIEIIQENNGKQFDPKCVEVFIDSLDEVREVLKKYNPSV